MPYFILEQDGKFCVVRGSKEEPGDIEKCYREKEEAQDYMKALYANVDEEDEKKEFLSKFISYKTADGIWRWTSISSVAIEDREREIVSEKAYDDAISHAQESNAFGELDVIHIDGTDIGDCDMMARLGFQLIESGTWRNTDKAQMVRSKIAEDPDRWGVSIQFRFDPTQFDGKIYQGGIKILKRSVLPRSMAASYGTAIAIQGGTEMKGKMTEEAKAVLLDLGYTEDDISSLAQKSKEVDPNVKNKVEEITEPVVEPTAEPTFREKAMNFFSDLFGDPQVTTQPDVVETKTEDPATTAVEKEIVEEIKVENKAEDTSDPNMAKEAMAALFSNVAELTAKAIRDAVLPLQEKIILLENRQAEAEKSIEEKVITRLNEVPPVVKARPTFLSPSTPLLPGEKAAGEPDRQSKQFVDAIVGLVKTGIDDGTLKLKI